MDWFNLHIPTMGRSPEYVGSSPAERGTWLSVMLYACQIECGGRIDGAASWKDRQWQQAAGVTLDEVKAANRLLRFDGDDLIVNGYPAEIEKQVRRNRKSAKAGGMARWSKTDADRNAENMPPGNADKMPPGMPPGNAENMPTGNAKGEGEGEGEVVRGNSKAAAAAQPCRAAQAAAAADPMGDAFEAVEQANPAPRRAIPPLSFADWRIQVGKRIFWTRDEDETWRAMFEAEGWDEMTKGYEFLAGKHPAPKKLFLSMFQELRA